MEPNLMLNRAILCTLLIVAVCFGHAQKHDWSRLDGKGAHGYNATSWGSGAQDMVCDEYGNIYSIGAVMGPYANWSNGYLDFGDSIYAQAIAGYSTPYIAKYNRRGEAQWALSLPPDGSASYLFVTALCIDTAGNAYIVGSTWNPVSQIAGVSVNTYGQGDIWIVKVNKHGVLQWAQTVGGNLQDYPTGITATPSGDVYITGLYQGYFQYGNTGISGSNSGWSVFLLKLQTDGTPYYCRRIATADGASAWQSAGGDVACDRYGNVYVSGSFTNTLLGGSTVLSAGSSVTDQNGFVMRVLPSTGVTLWARQMGSTASALAVDEAGEIYVAGKIQAGADSFHTTRLTTPGGLGFDDLYIARMGPMGQIRWVERFGDNTTTNSNPGWWWANQRLNISSLDVDFSGKIFISGSMDRSTDTSSICEFYVPPFTLNQTWQFNTDAFLLKITNNGTHEWNARSGIRKPWSVYYWDETTRGGGVSTDNAGATYWKTTRTWSATSQLDTVNIFFNNDTNIVASVDSLGYYTPALWAIREQYIEVDSFTPTSICPGDSLTIYYTKHGPFGDGNEFTVKLSNSVGVFFDAISIGSVTDTVSGVIHCFVPLTVNHGTNYRIRVDGTEPALRGYPTEFSLLIKPKPPTNAGPNDSMCFGDTITLKGSGGVNFSWFMDAYLADTTQDTTQAFPPATQNFILRSINPNSSCYNLDTIEVRVISHPALLPRPDTTICQGESVWLYSSGEGGKPKQYLYSWENTLTNVIEGYGDSLLVNPRVTTPYRLVLYDSCSLIRDTAIVTVNVRAHINSNARPDTLVCIGESVMIYASPYGGLDSQYHYRWYIDTNLVSTDSAFLWPSMDTTLSFKVVVDDGGCSDEMDSSWFTLFRRDSVKIFTRSDTLICDGQSILLHAWGSGGHEAGYTYTWSHGLASNDSNVVTPVQQFTTYQVTLNDGCTNHTSTEEITISLRYPLTVITRPDSLICRGESVLLHVDGTGGDSLHYTYHWHGVGVGNNLVVTPTDHTTYHVTLTDNCTALSTEDSVRITLRDPLKIFPMADTTICRENYPLLHAFGTGGHAPDYEFVWSDGLTETVLPAGVGYQVGPKTDQTFTVRLQDNCTVLNDSGDVRVFLRDWLSISTIPSDTVICHGALAMLNAFGTGGLGNGYTYTWENIGTGASKTVQPLTDSVFRVIMSDGCSPWDTGYVEVSIATPLSVTGFGDTLVCPEKALTLKAAGSGGVAAAYTYTWSHGLGDGTTKKVVPFQDEKYVVTLSDNCSFPAYDTVYVTMSPLPDTSIVSDGIEGCQPFEVVFNSGHQDTGGYSNWRWFLEPGLRVDGDSNSFVHTFTKPGLYPVKVLVTSNYGCLDSSRYIDITVRPKPVAIFDFSPASATIVEPTVQLLNASTNGETWLWDFGDGNSSTAALPNHTYADTGTYEVTLYVESPYQCKDTLSKPFRVNEIYSCYIPSGFTPNMDRVNDSFYVVGTGIEGLRVWIYDRWGGLVYYSDDMYFSWDGTHGKSGERLPDGVYMYRMVIDLENGDRDNRSGTISLVR